MLNYKMKHIKLFEEIDIDNDFEWEENEPKSGRYKIYTSRDGEITFGRNDLLPLKMSGNKFGFRFSFKGKYRSLGNHLDVTVDLDDMFIHIETNNGDYAEYKIFEE